VRLNARTPDEPVDAPVDIGGAPSVTPAGAAAEPLRVLVLDDETMLLRLFGRVLVPPSREPGTTLVTRAALAVPAADEAPADRGGDGEPRPPRFDVTTCVQAEQAVAAVRAALEEGRPFGVAFIDVELPPGMNGVWAAERIRRLDPHLEIVITTGHGTVSVEDLATRIPPVHRLSYFRKPMHVAEILNSTVALGARWRAAAEERRRQRALDERIAALEAEVRQAREEGAAVEPGVDVAASRGVSTVLVVEDEPVVRRLATRILTRRGYHVLEAEDGGAALRAAAESPSPVDLVLTDVVMPDMNGRHLATALRTRFPGVRVIFMSGYTTDELSADTMPTGARFLQKPFASGELAETVRAMLAGDPA